MPSLVSEHFETVVTYECLRTTLSNGTLRFGGLLQLEKPASIAGWLVLLSLPSVIL